MSQRLRLCHDQGQAAIEALLMITLGFMLVLAIHSIGQLRTSTLDLLSESYFLSFESQQSPDQRYSKVSAVSSTYSPLHQKIENQLGVDSSTLLRASAYSTPGLRSSLPTLGLERPTTLVRHSFLLSGYGQADSTRAAQKNIAASDALWQQSFVLSKQLVSANAPALQAIDQAWRRTPLTSDWLLPWENEVLTHDR
jgi:hypothetical protein